MIEGDWKAGVHTPSDRRSAGSVYGPKNPLVRGRVQADQRSAIFYPMKIPRRKPRGSSLAKLYAHCLRFACACSPALHSVTIAVYGNQEDKSRHCGAGENREPSGG
jgi:hypothetical protein